MSDKFADRETLIRLLGGSGDQALKAFGLQLLMRIERLETAQAALLRSVTGKLEQAAGLMDDSRITSASSELSRARALIDSMLEALS